MAIADVSHYVRDGDALDRDARERGTSVYFPRRVIPMLPEELSNELCSLKPDVDRACMACDMSIDAHGQIRSYRFYAALMHSRARLTYTQVWDWLSAPNDARSREAKSLLPHLEVLNALYRTLASARAKRGALDFDTLELAMKFDPNGKIEAIVPEARNDAHKLIEECMLAANVCAAGYLIERKHPALFRVHEADARKLEARASPARAHARRRRQRAPPTTRGCSPRSASGRTSICCRPCCCAHCSRPCTAPPMSATSGWATMRTHTSLPPSAAIRIS